MLDGSLPLQIRFLRHIAHKLIPRFNICRRCRTTVDLLRVLCVELLRVSGKREKYREERKSRSYLFRSQGNLETGADVLPVP